MVDMKGISKHGWRQLAAWTGFGTLGCVAVSAANNFMVFMRMGRESLPHCFCCHGRSANGPRRPGSLCPRVFSRH